MWRNRVKISTLQEVSQIDREKDTSDVIICYMLCWGGAEFAGQENDGKEISGGGNCRTAK